ncbi:MAG: hypothetical protein GIKADHBN_03659 [Phycisphaerales bacterium]|nr:hypothetical protein [Phycisphaerales bacterium]
MGLEFAIDELYATGWSALDSTDCDYLADGRCYPRPARVQREFAENGHQLTIRRVQLFDCSRAEWTGPDGEPAGAVVGQQDAEAAVYALAQLRRMLAAAPVAAATA